MPFLNECQFRAVSGGLTDFAVASAITGWYTPAQCTTPVVVDGGVYHWRAESDDGTQYESFEGTYTAATSTIARTTIFQSSNAGLAVNFSAAPRVRQVVLAQDLSAGGGITNPLTADLDVGGFSIEGADDDDGGAVDIHGGVGAVNNGGAVTLTGGQGEVDGGSLTLTAGAGNTGQGGDLQFTGGVGDGSGGSVIITGGVGNNVDFGGGGDAVLSAGAGVTQGGGIFAEGGDSSAGVGGNVQFEAGQGQTDGGGVSFIGGVAIDGNGGNVTLTGGSTADALGVSDGGDVALIGGNATLGNDGGSISLAPGIGNVDGGDVVVTLPAAGSGRQGRFYLINVETGDPADVGAVYVDGSGFLKLSL